MSTAPLVVFAALVLAVPPLAGRALARRSR